MLLSISIPEPWGICFDGANIWVAASDGLNKISARDGTVLGDPIDVGSDPREICFDGAHIWTANREDDSISKVRASDGEVIGPFSGFLEPRGICFGGSSIWVAVSGFDPNIWPGLKHITDAVVRLDSNGNPSPHAVGGNPVDICYDGWNIWVTNHDTDTVTKIYTDGSTRTFDVGDGPMGICFDGVYIWVANNIEHTVTKL